MLTIKASLKASPIEGIGVFADEKIPKGTVVWKFDPRFDLLFTTEEVAQMNHLQKELIDHFAVLSKESGKYVFSTDNSRFINHSATKNNLNVVTLSDDLEKQSFASKDIEKGEELLIDYRAIDVDDADSDALYLKR